MRYHGTDIDGPGFEPETLNVRGRDLNELIGSLSFVGAVYHILTGREPTEAQQRALDIYLTSALEKLGPSERMERLVTEVAGSGSALSCALMAAFLPDESE